MQAPLPVLILSVAAMSVGGLLFLSSAQPTTLVAADAVAASPSVTHAASPGPVGGTLLAPDSTPLANPANRSPVTVTPAIAASPTSTSALTSRVAVTADPTRTIPIRPAPRSIARIPATGSSAAPIAVPTPVTTPAPLSTAGWVWLPITKLAIPSIGLTVNVVPAPLVQIGDGRTWLVPSFKVGHGQYSAGAGDVGNAVLLGHVASLRDGSVFHDLYRVRVGDTVRVFSGRRTFDYRVTWRRIVSPSDVSVVQFTPVPSLTLITCAGEFVPGMNDFDERLIVRATLVPSPAATPALR